MHSTKRTTGPDAAARLRDRVEAATYLGVSRSTIDRLIANGQLPIVRLRGGHALVGTKRVLIDTSDLDRLIDQSKESRDSVEHASAVSK